MAKLAQAFDEAGGPHPRDYNDFDEWAARRKEWVIERMRADPRQSAPKRIRLP
jgi:hypothetical protein